MTPEETAVMLKGAIETLEVTGQELKLGAEERELARRRTRYALENWDELLASDETERRAKLAEIQARPGELEELVAYRTRSEVMWAEQIRLADRQASALERIAAALERSPW